MTFFFQSADGGAGALSRRLAAGVTLTFLVVAFGLLGGPGGSVASDRSLQLNPGATSFRQSNRNGLLSRSRAVLAFADVVHFFAYKFASLGAG